MITDILLIAVTLGLAGGAYVLYPKLKALPVLLYDIGQTLARIHESLDALHQLNDALHQLHVTIHEENKPKPRTKKVA
jgi:hypothetical protein